VADAVAQNPVMLAEVRRIAPEIEQLIAPAGDDCVKRVIGKAFAIYPQPVRGPEEWAAWWEAYFDTLSDSPAEAIEAAMKAWIRTDQTGFLPKPGQLMALVSKEAETAYRAVSRVRMLSRMSPPAPQLVQDEDPEARKRMAAEVRALFSIKPKSMEADHGR